MIAVRIPINTSEELLEEIKEWCIKHCPGTHHYFCPYYKLDESATVWFDSEVDAFAFRFKFNM